MQPIIENAFIHGIKYLSEEERGFIKLKIYQKEKEIIFEITNNGSGIDNAKLEEIQNNLKQNINSKHIGLSNINKRINLIFGDDYGCNIVSENDITTVTMNIPKMILDGNK